MTWFTPQPRFPPPETADDFGLLLIGGEMTPNWILAAYRKGIFPWPFEYEKTWYSGWFSPNPRAIIELDELHISRRLRDRLRSGKFRVTLNQDFSGVIAGCANAPRKEAGSWITPEMKAAYIELHQQGFAHSVETWLGERLVGGVYGLALGRFFAAESMFHSETDASKVALVNLVSRLRQNNFNLLDIQVLSSHTASLGAKEISRADFLRRLKESLKHNANFG